MCNSKEEINEDIIQMLRHRKLSYSSLKAFNKSPMHFVNYLLTKFEPSPAMVTGSVFDCLVLTPDDFDLKYAIEPVADGKTKAGKAIKEAFKETAGDREIITHAQHIQALAMQDSLNANGIGSRIINYKGTVQKKLNWKDKETGFEFVGYIDKDCDDYILDLKSCADASPEKFMRDAYKLDYPLQAAMYLLATHKLYKAPFIYVCVESKPPYGVAVYQATNDFISYGFNLYKRLIKLIEMCIKDKSFNKSYDFFPSTEYYYLDVPAYAKVNS